MVKVTKPTTDQFELALKELDVGPAGTLQFMADLATEKWRDELLRIFRLTSDATNLPENNCEQCGFVRACGEMASLRCWSNDSLYAK